LTSSRLRRGTSLWLEQYDGPRVSAPTLTGRHEADVGIDELTGDLIDLYPTARDLVPEYSWEGLFATTPDGLPYIGTHARYPRHLFALGYGGNGMTFGFLAGEILDRMIRGVARPEDDLFRFGRLKG
jgi:glycine/D-amino acid oxidase-like deaminating enzyme